MLSENEEPLPVMTPALPFTPVIDLLHRSNKFTVCSMKMNPSPLLFLWQLAYLVEGKLVSSVLLLSASVHKTQGFSLLSHYEMGAMQFNLVYPGQCQTL